MMRSLTILLIAVCSLVFVSCGDDAPTPAEQASNVVTDALTALYSGNVDSYISHSDFGEPMDSTKVMLLRLVLKRHVDEVSSRGGLKGVEPISSSRETDSLYCVSYSLKFNDGTKMRCVNKVRSINGEWRLCISE